MSSLVIILLYAVLLFFPGCGFCRERAATAWECSAATGVVVMLFFHIFINVRGHDDRPDAGHRSAPAITQLRRIVRAGQHDRPRAVTKRLDS